MGSHRAFPSLSLHMRRDSPTQLSTPRSSTSSPLSPTFPLSAKTSASSVSSIASCPPTSDLPIFPLSTKRSIPRNLPDLVEEPMEQDEGPRTRLPAIPDRRRSQQGRRSQESQRTRSRTITSMRSSEDFNARPSFSESYETDRRRTGEQTWHTFANGVKSRLGSLSRRSSQNNVDDRRSRLTPSPSPTFSRSRAASRSHSRRASIDLDAPEQQMFGSQIETIIEDERHDEDGRSLFPAMEEEVAELEEIDRQPTPLLPRFTTTDDYFEEIKSPLQSPTIAPTTMSCAAPITPAESPKMRSPFLSQKSSVASIRKRSSASSRLSDILPLDGATEGIDWAAKLGHEDFEITPEPYIPQDMTNSSHDQLLTDWNKARFEYSKHRSRVASNFSDTSAIYTLTEEKWATVDAQWKSNTETVFNHLCQTGQISYPSPREPAPVRDLTDINDPRLVQPLEIVGPMPQDAPIITNPSKRESWFKTMRAKTRNKRSLSALAHPHRTPSGLYW